MAGGRERPGKSDGEGGSPPPAASDAEPEAGQRSALPFPVVGVGASAGGLEAFTALLENLPAETGMAFVVVQHLDPNHESMLSTLLARATRMPVLEAADGQPVEPNHVYVIPPNASIEMQDCRLAVGRREGALPHRPVDAFLRSLAREQRGLAIAVILSGTASDGALGVKEVKGEGGFTFAQDEASARYEGMPRAAVATGCVDMVLDPNGIARELADIARHPFVLPSGATRLHSDGDALGRVLAMLQKYSGVNFSSYKPSTLRRRIARRLLLHKLESLDEYLEVLRTRKGELEALYDDVLINVTSFFRDAEVFAALKTTVFPEIYRRASPDTGLRVWVPGCSTGEEPFSIAIALREFLDQQPRPVPFQIFATDINEDAIERARLGHYPDSIALDVSEKRLERFFARVDGGYLISKSIRDSCVFARQDLTRDPPFSRLDLISCRNLLIYLGPVLQRRVMPVFHYALKTPGYLLLGSSETVGSFADLFSPVDRKHKIYARKPSVRSLDLDLAHLPHRLERPSIPMVHEPSTGGSGPLDLRREADRTLLNRYAPAAVIVSAALDVVQFRGRTGYYLEPEPGPASLNLLRMAREGLRHVLKDLLKSVLQDGVAKRREDVRVQSNGEYRVITVEVLPLLPPAAADPHYLVIFEDPEFVPLPRPIPLPERAADLPADVVHLQEELSATREYLQSIVEEHEASSEELKSANEEILSANEELQSLNEEMETAKEELQSTNEELTTVNEELHERNAELGQVNSDLRDLLNNISICVLMLSRDLRIRRFNPPAEKVLNLIPSDVGRPFTDIKPNLEVDDLGRMVRDVVDNLTVKEMEVRDAEGRWHALRLRPYRTLDNRIDGAVLTLVDVHGLKESLEEARDLQRVDALLLEITREVLVVLDAEGRVREVSQAYREAFLVGPDVVGKRLADLPPFRRRGKDVRSLLERAVREPLATEPMVLEDRADAVPCRRWEITFHAFADDRRAPRCVLVRFETK